MTEDPIKKFEQWLAEAKANSAIVEPTAMALATADGKGVPSLRMVLLKEVTEKGFVFYTNLESHKGRDILENPNVALCFYWGALDRQVRIEGICEKVSDEEADAYFASRTRASQLGAWASKQSQPLSSKAQLMKDVALLTAKYIGRDVPRPPHWSGWRVVPSSIEFWQQGAFRLHDRELFTRKNADWELTLLYP
jgi:pyridoxamine 5'-phosphate oxidase